MHEEPCNSRCLEIVCVNEGTPLGEPLGGPRVRQKVVARMNRLGKFELCIARQRASKLGGEVFGRN